MMTAIQINKMGKTFATRQAARDWANQNGGQVVDMAKRDPGFVDGQILCDKYHVENKSARWVVIFNRIICHNFAHRQFAKALELCGKTVVLSKKRYMSLLIADERIGRIV